MNAYSVSVKCKGSYEAVLVIAPSDRDAERMALSALKSVQPSIAWKVDGCIRYLDNSVTMKRIQVVEHILTQSDLEREE